MKGLLFLVFIIWIIKKFSSKPNQDKCNHDMQITDMTATRMWSKCSKCGYTEFDRL